MVATIRTVQTVERNGRTVKIKRSVRLTPHQAPIRPVRCAKSPDGSRQIWLLAGV